MTNRNANAGAFVLMLAAVGLGGPLQAQSIDDFRSTRNGFYAEAYQPMSQLERVLFRQVRAMLDERHNEPDSGTLESYPQVDGSALLSVHISQGGTVMANMKPSTRPRTEFIYDDLYHQMLGTSIEDALDAYRPYKPKLDERGLARPRNRILFVFGGFAFGPSEEKLREVTLPKSSSRFSSDSQETVVVSASHGLFRFVDDEPDWRWQRPLVNGIREDTLTPILAQKLAIYLESRSQSTAVFARDHQNTETNEASGRPWLQMAARYYLWKILLDNSEIWDSTIPPVQTPAKMEHHTQTVMFVFEGVEVDPDEEDLPRIKPRKATVDRLRRPVAKRSRIALETICETPRKRRRGCDRRAAVDAESRPRA